MCHELRAIANTLLKRAPRRSRRLASAECWPPIDAAAARSAICIAITGLNAYLLCGTIGLIWLGMIVGAMLAFAIWVHFIYKPRPVAPPTAA